MRKISKKDKKYLLYFFTELFDTDIPNDINIDLSKEEFESIKKLIDQRYKATFGVVGCTGAGKTTTLYSLFGFKRPRKKTEKVNIYTKNLGKGVGDIIFYDFPGIGDFKYKKEFIEAQYEQFLSKCDVILWVINGSTDLIELDEEYLKKLKPDIKDKVIIGLHRVNQVDPYDTWDNIFKIPSRLQEKNIEKKRREIASNFKFPIDKIIPYSAYVRYNTQKTIVYDARYNLEALVKALVSATSEHQFIIGNAFLKEITDNRPSIVKKGSDPIREKIIAFFNLKDRQI